MNTGMVLGFGSDGVIYGVSVALTLFRIPVKRRLSHMCFMTKDLTVEPHARPGSWLTPGARTDFLFHA